MKSIPFSCFGALLALSGAASAANLAFDNASSYQYGVPFPWDSGSNGGYGWGPWSLTTTGSAQNFIYDSTTNGDGIDDGLVGGAAADGDINSVLGPDPDTGGTPPNNTPGRAWALFADPIGSAQATRGLTGGALGVGQTISLDFDNGTVEGTGRVSIQFLNIGGQTLFETYYQGTDANYTFVDGAGSAASSIAAGTEGLNLKLGLTGIGTYVAILTRADGASNMVSGSLIPTGDQNVAQVRISNFGAGTDGASILYANNLSVIPEPGSAMLSLSALGLLLVRRRR